MFEDSRSRLVVFVSHCILNNNTKAMGLVAPESSRRCLRFLEELLMHGIGVVQMPCPELFFGLPRAPATKMEYNTPEFREHCNKIAVDVAKSIANFTSAGVRVLAVVGVEGSPSCGVRWTHAARGEQASKGRGIFFESLERKLIEMDINVKLVGLPGKSSYGNIDEMMEEVLNFDRGCDAT